MRPRHPQVAALCDSVGVSGRDNTDLAMVRYLLGEAARRAATLAQNQDHPQITDGRDSIEDAITAITRAAGGSSPWAHTRVYAPLFALTAWIIATVGGRTGLSAGWTISATTLAILAMIWPLAKLNLALTNRVNQRRLATAPPFRVQTPTDITPAEQVLHVLGTTRSMLAVTMRRRAAADRFGYAARSTVGFNWLRHRNTGVYFASLADRCVCQAIYAFETWLRAVEHQR